MTIKLDIYNQWIDYIKTELIKRFGSDKISDYGNEHDYAIAWFKWQRRLIIKKTRILKKSKEFNCPKNRINGHKKLEEAISNGFDLSPWLSISIKKLKYEDEMLNDWGIHHLHLGENKKTDGFIERTNELLFAVFTNDTCYEIGIFKHGDWSEIDLLEIINNNFPELINSKKLKGIVDIQYSPKTRKEILDLRKAHVCYLIKLSDGSILLPPGGGVATDGSSIDAVTIADYWGHIFRKAEKDIEENIQKLIKDGILPDNNYLFSLNIYEDLVCVVEPNYNIRFDIWRKNV